jgi:phage-related protein
MDGAAYTIEMQAQAVGVGATASEVVALANAIDATAKVATTFDSAIAAAKAQLAQAANASAAAADGLRAAEGSYAGLEREATRAAKAIERASVKGNVDPSGMMALVVQAERAAQAVTAQAAAVDKAKASATAAAAEEKRLADALKSLEGAATKSATKLQSAGKESAQAFQKSGQSLDQLASQLSPTAGKFVQLKQAIGGAGVAGAVMLAAAAVAALVVGLGAAAFAAAKFAIAGDKVAKARLDKISKKAADAFASLFSGIKTTPLLNALDRMVESFGRNSAAGGALARLIERIMNPLIAGIEAVQPLAHELWNGLVYGALQVAIMVIKARNAILKLIPDSVKGAIRDFIAKLDAMGIAFSVGKVIMYAVAAVLGLVAVAFVAVGATIATVVAFFVGVIKLAILVVEGFWAALQTVGAWIGEFATAIADGVSAAYDAVATFCSDAWSAISDWVSGAVQAGTDFVMGLAQGIADAASAVVDAAKELASSAVDAVTEALDIGSPSRVMRGKGRFGGQGLAMGFEDEEGEVRGAVERLTGIADEQIAGPSGRVLRVEGDKSTTSTVGGNTYQITIQAPSGDAEDIRSAFERWLTSSADAIALQVGGGEVPA